MRSFLISLILFSPLLFSQSKTPNSFEANYLLLQNKITALKDKGEKIGEQTHKELDALMVQMNHEHTELRRQFDKKNVDINQKVSEGLKTGQDWSTRALNACHELVDGFKRAWNKIKKDAD